MRHPRLAALVSFGLLQAATAMAQPADQEQQLQALQQAIAGIKRDLGNTRQQRASVASQLQALEAEISAVQRALQELDARIAGSQQQLGALEQQSDALEQQRRLQLAHIEAYLRSAQQAGQASTLKLVLSQDDPTRSARLLRYARYLGQARLARLDSFRTTLTAMGETSAGIEVTTEVLHAQRTDLAASQAELALRQEERQALLDQLDIELQTGDQELARLEDERATLEALLEELRQSILALDFGDADTPFRERRGQLPWPVDGQLLHGFGSRHELGDLRREGVTLGAEAGTQVRAVHYGRVVFADWLGSSGQLLIIDHGDGFMTLYAHNQELRKTEGDWVAAGDVIATVGNTGGQRDPALYFEIRRNGKAENPVNWCVARR